MARFNVISLLLLVPWVAGHIVTSLYPQYVQKHGQLYEWTADTVFELGDAAGLPGGVMAAMGRERLDGLDLIKTKLSLPDAGDADAFEQFTKELRLAVWLERNLLVTEDGLGSSDFELLTLRSLDRRGFSLTLFALENFPRITTLYLYYYQGEGNALHLFATRFGHHQFSWLMWLVAPDLISVRHFLGMRVLLLVFVGAVVFAGDYGIFIFAPSPGHSHTLTHRLLRLKPAAHHWPCDRVSAPNRRPLDVFRAGSVHSLRAQTDCLGRAVERGHSAGVHAGVARHSMAAGRCVLLPPLRHVHCQGPA
jgi:hypothetical protein